MNSTEVKYPEIRKMHILFRMFKFELIPISLKAFYVFNFKHKDFVSKFFNELGNFTTLFTFPSPA